MDYKLASLHFDEKSHLELRKLTSQDLDSLIMVESVSYSHPWTRINFLYSLEAGYLMQGIFKVDQRNKVSTLIGYFVAMKGVDEYHLLNITVAPSFQRRGFANHMLDVLKQSSMELSLHWIWLEVRASNAGAIALYTAYGFNITGERKNYYPYGKLGSSQRENAVLMSFKI